MLRLLSPNERKSFPPERASKPERPPSWREKKRTRLPLWRRKLIDCESNCEESNSPLRESESRVMRVMKCGSPLMTRLTMSQKSCLAALKPHHLSLLQTRRPISVGIANIILQVELAGRRASAASSMIPKLGKRRSKNARPTMVV